MSNATKLSAWKTDSGPVIYHHIPPHPLVGPKESS
jgi:hypothetical protein